MVLRAHLTDEHYKGRNLLFFSSRVRGDLGLHGVVVAAPSQLMIDNLEYQGAQWTIINDISDQGK